MVYELTQEHGKQVKIEDVPQEQRDIFLADQRRSAQELAKQAVQIEKHYGRPMDIEWAKDGHTGKLFIVQARPETVRSRGQVMERYTLHGSQWQDYRRRPQAWSSHRCGSGESHP